jgi:hypothetical protein
MSLTGLVYFLRLADLRDALPERMQSAIAGDI